MEHTTDTSHSNNNFLLNPNQTSQTKTTNMSELLDLRWEVLSRICNMERCLMEITLPIQEHIYVKNINRIQELTLQANTDILDIEANHRKAISLI